MQNKYLKHVRKCLNIVTKTITTKRLHTYSLILAKSLGGRCYPRFPYSSYILRRKFLSGGAICRRNSDCKLDMEQTIATG